MRNKTGKEKHSYNKMNPRSTPKTGWSWAALLIGPFWYIMQGLWGKGVFLLALSIITLGLGVPFIWIYCAAKAKSDLYERKLSKKSKFDIDNI